ncbi:MAG: cobalamin B12-binding domain-containing protein, partial [Bryobacteraceae bacterium]
SRAPLLTFKDLQESAKRLSLAGDPGMSRKIRVLVAKPGLDGHDRGAKVIARALRDAGMEVIYTGLRQTPEMIVNAALQEDVQVIGLSILSGAHNAIVPRVLELLRAREMTDILLVLGGIIPDDDACRLKESGVAAIFQPGASLDSIVQFIRENVHHHELPVGAE